MFSARESGNQHHQRAFRQMEIGNQRVDAAEFVARIDENIGPVIVLTDLSAFFRDGFDRAAARRANRDDAPAAPLRPTPECKKLDCAALWIVVLTVGAPGCAVCRKRLYRPVEIGYDGYASEVKV